MSPDRVWIATTEPLTIRGQRYKPGQPALIGVALAGQLIAAGLAVLLKGADVPKEAI